MGPWLRALLPLSLVQVTPNVAADSAIVLVVVVVAVVIPVVVFPLIA